MTKQISFPSAGASSRLQSHTSVRVPPAHHSGPAQSIAGVDPILRAPAVQAATGLSRSARRLLEIQGDFPARVHLSPHGRAVGWRASEVAQWLESRTRVGDVQ